MNKVVLHLACGVDPNPPPDAYGYITKVLMRGTGANPFAMPQTLNVSGTVYIFRAPITGNDSQEEITNEAVTIDRYAIDPLNRHLWLRATGNITGKQGWVKVVASDEASGTVLKPQGCSWVKDTGYAGADRIILRWVLLWAALGYS
jgi:hypothetical protein